ncbi:MAG: PA0069 family radical SAM protein [Gammaproteobacteria bacterium]|nr:MAG: PA0069 family radical SAM protein [Gammaproteobacteria bacterium]
MNDDKKIVHRGAGFNPQLRFQQCATEAVDDGWYRDEELSPLQTEIMVDTSKSIITRNTSPDVPFSQSINPYRGCEHGCIYCFARPSHAYLDLSPGLDFETKLIIKPDAAKLLRKELAKKNYQCDTIAMGTNTDPYQPIEIEHGITRSVIEVLAECNHPLSIVTKSALIERDIDLLQDMAKKRLVHVMISVTTLDKDLCRAMEPRAAVPARRLKTIQRLTEAGIPTGVLMAPIIPFLNDAEIEDIVAAVAAAGANSLAYVFLRLPIEVKDLFYNWLLQHYPLKAERIMQRIRDSRNGKEYDASFGQRMTGSGKYVELIQQRFNLAIRNAGLSDGYVMLDTSHFTPPQVESPQLSLF